MAQSNQGGKVKLPSTHLAGATKLAVIKMTGSPLSLTHSRVHTYTLPFITRKLWPGLEKAERYVKDIHLYLYI